MTRSNIRSVQLRPQKTPFLLNHLRNIAGREVWPGTSRKDDCRDTAADAFHLIDHPLADACSVPLGAQLTAKRSVKRKRSLAELGERSGVGDDHWNDAAVGNDDTKIANCNASLARELSCHVWWACLRNHYVRNCICIDRYLFVCRIPEHEGGWALIHSPVVGAARKWRTIKVHG